MSVSETLQRAISEGHRAGSGLIQLSITEGAAWDLAGEMEALQMFITPFTTQGHIYRGLVDGGMQFMGIPVAVAATDEALK